MARMAVKAPDRPAAGGDEHVMVVVDSVSGEVRECGDHSGYCIAMNPWAQAATEAQRLPVDITKQTRNCAPSGRKSGFTRT